MVHHSLTQQNDTTNVLLWAVPWHLGRRQNVPLHIKINGQLSGDWKQLRCICSFLRVMKKNSTSEHHLSRRRAGCVCGMKRKIKDSWGADRLREKYISTWSSSILLSRRGWNNAWSCKIPELCSLFQCWMEEKTSRGGKERASGWGKDPTVC